jgi:UDP-N-acetylglucosamine--N-acetylmuramyl-(pentapeptide) pyrophosphoryl-undecaprenol N-acetylglucosamine transferase
LAVADALAELRPGTMVTALGTRRGLEQKLVPARGYPLELVPAVPLPRKLSRDLFTVPQRLRRAVYETAQVLDRVGADALVGFGGYVAVPAYLAARRRRIPIVVHEANVRAGLANRIGALWAARVFTASSQTKLRAAAPVGIPVRRQITQLDRARLRQVARAHFGLDPDAPTLLVFGGSQGARALNEAVVGLSGRLTGGGVQILHAKGPKQVLPAAPSTGHVVVDYLERMDLAYAAADLALCRSGAMTVAEVSSVGLPAIFVPLPHGNGEQSLNALGLVGAGGGFLCAEQELADLEAIATLILDVLHDEERLARMAAAASSAGSHDAADTIAKAALDLAAGVVG